MPELPRISGDEVIRIFKKLGFYEARQRGGGMTIYNWENGGKIYKLKHRRLVSYFLGME